MKVLRAWILGILFINLLCLVCLPVMAVKTAPVLLPSTLTGPYDHSAWDQFLKNYVNENGQMDYAGAKQHPEMLHQYLNQLESLTMRELEGWPREERLALWLNAYHAGLVKIILEHYPLKSIQDIPGGWETSVIRLDQKGYSLNQIRTRQLIEMYRDEKIHLALACGAVSCPEFPQEAFTGPRVEGQLFLAARKFVNLDRYVKIIPGKNKIWISRIFKWYAVDFKLDFGTPDNDMGLSPEEAAVLSFIAYYLEDTAKIAFLEERNYKIKYLSFDWALDEWRKNIPAEGNSKNQTVP